MTLLVTGGAGFIGSNFVLDWLAESDESVVNLDKLTYAGNLQNLSSVAANPKHIFVPGDMGDAALVAELLATHKPRAILNFAAESHVDRSILGPGEFIQTNIVGTFNLLETVRSYWSGLDAQERAAFRFVHVSTDEVFGSLSKTDPAFTETHCYAPNSPYSASKAASDHLVRAYHHTYGLPVLTTHCSNNYGPFHFPEKLIPLIIVNAQAGKPLPVYGDGQQIRYVTDRPGHDRRYAIDASKIERELDWKPVETFDTGIRKTVQWYLDNPEWVTQVQSGAYREWVSQQYGSPAATATAKATTATPRADANACATLAH